MKLIKSIKFLSIFTLFIKANAQDNNDCTYLEKALNIIGKDEKLFNKVTNCCDYNTITCDNQFHITEMYISIFFPLLLLFQI